MRWSSYQPIDSSKDPNEGTKQGGNAGGTEEENNITAPPVSDASAAMHTKEHYFLDNRTFLSEVLTYLKGFDIQSNIGTSVDKRVSQMTNQLRSCLEQRILLLPEHVCHAFFERRVGITCIHVPS